MLEARANLKDAVEGHEVNFGAGVVKYSEAHICGDEYFTGGVGADGEV